MATIILKHPVSGKILRTPAIVPVNTGYGLLYNWWAASAANFAPAGFRLGTTDEFSIVQSIYGGMWSAGAALKETLLIHWASPNTGATNVSSFKGVGAGGRQKVDGSFSGLNGFCYTWLKASDPSYTWATFLLSNLNIYAPMSWSSDLNDYKYGYSVRFILDDPTSWYPGMTVTDFEGNVYRTVKIGDQVWLADNWQSEYYNNGTPIQNVTDNAVWAALTTPAYCAYNNDKATYVSSLKPVAGKILRITV